MHDNPRNHSSDTHAPCTGYEKRAILVVNISPGDYHEKRPLATEFVQNLNESTPFSVVKPAEVESR